MVILALETVTRAGSLAIVDDQGTSRAVMGDPARTHSVRLPGELLRFVESDGRRLRDVDIFAVVTGPGSFTGLRIGLATIQGLALAGNRPVIGIPTLEAIASGWLDTHAGETERLVACLDGAREDVFYAMYDVDGAGSFEGASAVIDPRVSTAPVAATEIAAARDGRSLAIVGAVRDRFRDLFTVALPGVRVEPEMPNLAASAGRLAARRASTAANPHALKPIYLRRPDAVLARERQAGDVSMFEVTAPDDVASVAHLQARSFGNAWSEDALMGTIANRAVSRLYGARRSSGELVAYCAAWRVLDELHINSLAVDPEFRRQGIARALLKHVLALAAASGATGATLEVRRSNDAGRALYEALGFQVEGVRPGYYQDPREDALILWKRNLGDAKAGQRADGKGQR